MKKRFLAGILLCMTAVLAGCGNSNAQESSDVQKTTTKAVTTAAETDLTETETKSVTTASAKKENKSETKTTARKDESSASEKKSAKTERGSSDIVTVPDNSEDQELPILSEQQDPDNTPSDHTVNKETVTEPEEPDNIFVDDDGAIVLPFVPIEDMQ